jgi:hypothetical protein
VFLRLNKICLVLSVVTVAMAAGLANAQTKSLIPFLSEDTHLGVASCAGSSCHGALEPWDSSTVLQNEYIVWEEDDPHSSAYKTLLTDESQRIARNLGLGRAEEEALCLDCHADNVPDERRAKGFHISDGVGCEACHGGAVNWLGRHISGEADHSANLTAGLYPSEDPVARAKLCLSCHFGTEDRFLTHRIMGAGHPRLAFELDTYTWTQPAHAVVDNDYRVRKGDIQSIKVWAVGQAVAVDSLLDAMLDPKRNTDGIFPELVFFDCHACHHPMSNIRWAPRDSHDIGPGIPRIYDANLIMMRVLLRRVDPVMAGDLEAKSKLLHQASLEGYDAVIEAARGLKTATEGAIERFATHTFTAADMNALMGGVIEEGLAGEFVDYAAAEQATMATSAILQAMVDDNVITRTKYIELSGVLDDCYRAIEKDEEYDPRQFLAALQRLQGAIPRI